MKKLLLFNKRNIGQLLLFTFFFALLLITFAIYFAQANYTRKVLSHAKQTHMEDSYLILNNDMNKTFEKSFFQDMQKAEGFEHIYRMAIPPWSMNAETGLSSIPQIIDEHYLSTARFYMENEIDFSALEDLEANHYYLILSPLSSLQVGDNTTLVDSKTKETITLHAITRLKPKQLHFNFFVNSSNNKWTDTYMLDDKRDYILVSDMYDNSINWEAYASFIIKSDPSEHLDKKLDDYLLNKNLTYEKGLAITERTLEQIDEDIYRNISFILIVFIMFTSFYINSTYLNNLKFKKRYTIYRKLGASKNQIVLWRFLAFVFSLGIGYVIATLGIFLLNSFRPALIFSSENVYFDQSMIILFLILYLFYLLIGLLALIVTLREE